MLYRIKISSTKEARQITALKLIHDAGGLTRAELAARLDLNMTAVIRLVTDLIEDDLLHVDADPTLDNLTLQGRGRPAEILKLYPYAGYSLGLEFGRGQLTLTLTNTLGDLVAWTELDRPPVFEATADVVNILIAELHKFTSAHNVAWTRVTALGLALHDVVDAEGNWTTQHSTTPFQVMTYLYEHANLTHGVPIVVEDVSRSFAFAEHKCGAARARPDFIYLFLGKQGIGSGIFVNDTLLKSSSGVCGELGHVNVVPDGKQCQCGSQGCLETVATYQAVETRFNDLVSAGVETTLDIPDISFLAICQASAQGDKAAYLVLDELASHLSYALAAAVNISGAPCVVVGGHLRHAGQGFLNILETALKRLVVGPLLKHIHISYAALPDYAGAWGASLMALEQSFARGSLIHINAKTHELAVQ
ncbi:MAG: ROK family transcriptional regulator [Deinococcota bacterium]